MNPAGQPGTGDPGSTLGWWLVIMLVIGLVLVLVELALTWRDHREGGDL